MHLLRRTTTAERGGRASVIAMALALTIGAAVPVSRAQAQTAAAPPAQEEMEVPHPFFTHEGLPDPVGSFSLRTAAVATRVDGRTEGDFAFHLETGLTKSIGLHIRNDRFLNNKRTEAMLQFVAFTNKSGTSGFAPLIEFEFPTRSGGGSRVNTLVGQTAKLANSRVAINEVLHYNPREDGVEGSASLVAVATPWLFPVVELIGDGGRERMPVVNVVAGLKVRIIEGVLLGFAYRVPVTKTRDFASQFVLQPDVHFKLGQ